MDDMNLDQLIEALIAIRGDGVSGNTRVIANVGHDEYEVYFRSVRYLARRGIAVVFDSEFKYDEEMFDR